MSKTLRPGADPADTAPLDDGPCHAERVALFAAVQAAHSACRARYEQRLVDAEVHLSRCLLFHARRRMVCDVLDEVRLSADGRREVA